MPNVVFRPHPLRRALATLTVLLLGTVSAVSVWLPEGRRAAILDNQGLRLPAGALLSVLGPAEPATVSGQRVRIMSSRLGTSGRMEVVSDRNAVLASMPLPPGVSALAGTRRGPCYTRVTGSDPLTVCLSPDLKTEWARFSGEPLLITSSGDTAYLTHWSKRGAPYARDVPVTRLDLTTLARTALTVNAELGDPSPADRRAVAKTYDANNVVRSGRELSGNRFVACVSVSLAKYDCRLTVFDREPTRPGGLDDTALALTRNSVVVVSPNGTATTLDLARQTIRSVTLPGFSGTLTLTPLGEVVAVTRASGGTVILDPAGRVRFRVEDGRVPVRVGETLFVPSRHGLTAFRLP